MTGQGREHALDHVVVVVFENRSLDNVLGRLYGPEDGKTFDGVTGKDLTNLIPAWAEHGTDRKVVPCTVATGMDSPNPVTVQSCDHRQVGVPGTCAGFSEAAGSMRCRRMRRMTAMMTSARRNRKAPA